MPRRRVDRGLSPIGDAGTGQHDVGMGTAAVRRMRWWQWLIAGIAVLYLTSFVAASWLRQHNERRCFAAIAALEAQGFPCHPPSIAVAIDVAASDDYWRRAIALSSTAREKPMSLQAWLDDGRDGTPGPEAMTWLAARRAEFDGLLRAVEPGRVSFSSAISCPVPLARPAGVPATMPMPYWRSEAVQVALAMAEWQRVEALLSADPRAHLEALERLIAAYGIPGGLVDVMMRLRLEEIRDETMLDVIRRQHLPPDLIDAWLSAATPASDLLAHGWCGERVQSWPMSEWLVRNQGGETATLLDRIDPSGWWFLATLSDGETRRMVDVAGFEAVASGRSPPVVALGFGGGSSIIYRIAMPNLKETPIAVAGLAHRAHLRRLAARIVQLSRDQRQVPLTQADLAPAIDPALFAAGIDHGGAIYHRNGVDEFVLVDDGSASSRLPAPRAVKHEIVRFDVRVP